MSAAAHGDWDAPPQDRSSLAPALVVAAIVATGSVGAVLCTVAGQAWWIGAILGAAVVTGWILVQPRLALASANAHPADPERDRRVINIVAGLAGDLGAPAPRIYIGDGGGPNALVCRRGGPVLVITRDLVDGYALTELEAVVAHCLRRIADGDMARCAWAAALPFLAGDIAPHVGTVTDVKAVEVTRYPPALAKAISAATPRRGRLAPFWFVAEGPSHDSAAARAAALADL